MKGRAELEDQFRTKADELFESVIGGELEDIVQTLRDVLGKAFDIADGPEFFVPVEMALERFDKEALPLADKLYSNGAEYHIPSALYKVIEEYDSRSTELAHLQMTYEHCRFAVSTAIQSSISRKHEHLDIAERSVLYERMYKETESFSRVNEPLFGGWLHREALRTLSETTRKEVDFISESNTRRLAMGLGTSVDSSKVKEGLEALDELNNLPPLVKFLIDKNNSYARIAMLVERLLPGFADYKQITQRQKSRFLAALTGKNAETFRQKWGDHNGRSRAESTSHKKKDEPAIRRCLKEIDEYLKAEKLQKHG